MSFTDKTLTCKDCNQEFIWTSGEQEFYQTRGLVNEPGRCPSCRATRRANGGGAGSSYGHLQQLWQRGARAIPAARRQARVLQLLLRAGPAFSDPSIRLISAPIS